jgi:hypothetical protein
MRARRSALPGAASVPLPGESGFRQIDLHNAAMHSEQRIVFGREPLADILHEAALDVGFKGQIR